MKSTFNHDNWQQALIETNLLAIGFNAWNGYSKAGRGVVVCSTNSPLVDRFLIQSLMGETTPVPTTGGTPATDWLPKTALYRFGETFKTHFVPRPRLAAFLNAWLATPDTVILQGHHMNGHILDAVDNYNPEQDVILLLESGMRVSFFYLKNLPITPPECYQRVKQAWSEFQPSANYQYQTKPDKHLINLFKEKHNADF